MAVVCQGDWVLCRLADGNEKIALVQNDTPVRLGKLGSVKGSSIIGLTFGYTYELLAGEKLRLAPPEEIESVSTYAPSSANNQELVDDNKAQGLSMEEIQELKTQGVPGDDIVKRLISSSATFASKTEFSQAKYIKRKREKYLKIFTIIQLTTRVLAEYYFTKSPMSILELRVDSLSQLLTLANVRAGSRILVVDDVNGLLVAACMQRMSGQGVIVGMQQSHQPHFEAVKFLHIPKAQKELLQILNWKRARSDLQKEIAALQQQLSKKEAEGLPEKTGKRSGGGGDPKHRIDQLEKVLTTCNLVRQGNFDALLVASKFDTVSLLQSLLPLLAPSRPFALFSQNAEALGKCHHLLRSESWAVNINLTDTWTREYQVLSGRTHPMMTTSAASGFILSGTTIRPDRDDVTNARVAYSHHVIFGDAIPEQAKPEQVKSDITQVADATDSVTDTTVEDAANENNEDDEAHVDDDDDNDDDDDAESSARASKRVRL